MTAILAEHARRAGVRDVRVLDALVDLDRAAFVPDDVREWADEDRPLPIGHGQTASQPSLQARMVEALELSGDERVLELGTGAGFQTALLARLAGEVWSVDVDDDLSARAATALERLGISNVRLVVADGLSGLADAPPFDAAIVSFAIAEVPRPVLDDLVEGGRVVAPVLVEGVDPAEGRCDVRVFRRIDGALVEVDWLCGAHFVRARDLGRPT